MTNNNNSVAPNDVPATGTNPYSQAVATIQQALDTIIAAIPATAAKEQSTVGFVRRRQAVQPALIDRAATTVEVTPAFQGLLDPAEARDTLAFTTAFRPVFDRMNGIAEDLKFSIDTRHAASGSAALSVYAAAKRAAKGPNGAVLASHVANMKEVVKRGSGKNGKKKAAKEPVTPPAPATSAAPATPSTPAEPVAAKQS